MIQTILSGKSATFPEKDEKLAQNAKNQNIGKNEKFGKKEKFGESRSETDKIDEFGPKSENLAEKEGKMEHLNKSLFDAIFEEASSE